MSKEDKIELLKALRELQVAAKKYPSLVSYGFCNLFNPMDSFVDREFTPILELFFKDKVEKVLAQKNIKIENATFHDLVLFRVGVVKKRMEWLQVEIEKLEACIH